MKMTLAVALGAASFATSASANAATLIDYQASDATPGYTAIYNPGGFVAVGFLLDQHSVLTGASFEADPLLPSAPVPQTPSEIDWTLYRSAGSAAAPGAQVASGSALPAGISRSVISTMSWAGITYENTRFTFDLPSIDLSSGIYYLSLHAATTTPIGTSGAVAATGLGGSPGAFYSLNGGATWTAGTTQVVSIIGNVAAVPEPASWALMIGGFGLVGGAARRSRATIRFV